MTAIILANALVRRPLPVSELWRPLKPLAPMRPAAADIGRAASLPPAICTAAPAPRAAARAPAPSVGAVVHEMRNFLAPMDTSIELLRRTVAGDERSTRALELLQRQTAALGRLVEDLLEVERIGAGKLDLRREPCDLGSVAADVLQMCMPAAQARSIEMSVEPCDQAVTATGDGVRLRQALSNVVFNAIRYTQQGGHVQVQAGAVEGRAFLRVTDDGRGIEPRLLGRIFEPYVQERDGEKGGLGIGLYLVRTIMRLHGGEVEAASDGAGQGSTFTLWLPR